MKTELETALETLNIKLTSVYLGEGAKDGWKHDRWTVTVERDGRTFETEYRTGLGHRETVRAVHGQVTKPVAPKLADVISGLLSDAQAGRMSFDEFCGEFGYDSDSRKALATWEACVNTAGPLARVLGADMDRLAGLEH